MGAYPFMPEGCYPVEAVKPQLANAAANTADYISLKNAQMCWIVVHLTQVTDHPLTLVPYRATKVDGTGAVVLANAVPIWYGNVSATSSALAAQADAVNFTIPGAVTGDTITIFQIDPANLGSSYDVINIIVSQSAHADNIVSVMYWIKPRYESKVASMSATEFLVD